MRYFDAHCHIQFDPYDEDRDALIGRMRTEAIGGLVVGTNLESSQKAVALGQMHEHLYASVGLHPNAVDVEEFDISTFEDLAKNDKVVAIGECGLDYYRPEDPDAAKEKQKELFQAHVDLAVRVGKPLIIHARPTRGTMNAYEDALDILEAVKREHPDLRGDFHFFVGDVATAERIVALDFTVSFTAVLTFARDYDNVVRSVPRTHILSETDAPYVAPLSRRGERNDPFAIPEIVRLIAQIRGESEEVVQQAVLKNAQHLFRI